MDLDMCAIIRKFHGVLKLWLWGEYWHAKVALNLQGCQSGRRSMMAAAELRAAVCHSTLFIYYMFLWEVSILVLQYCFTTMYIYAFPWYVSFSFFTQAYLSVTWLDPFWTWFLYYAPSALVQVRNSYSSVKLLALNMHSSIVAQVLRVFVVQSFTGVTDMGGGYLAWKESGLPVKFPQA